MEIKLCAFADEACPDFEGQLSALKKNNISLLELRNADGVNVADLKIESAEKMKKMLDGSGIKVWSLGSPIGKIKITDDFENHLKTLRHIFDLCGIFECGKIRVFSFFTSNPENDRNEVLRRMNIMCAEASKRGVKLYHENEKDIYGDSVERVKDLLKNIEGLGSVFDPANFIQCGEEAGKAADELISKTDYLHIKDVISETGELVPAGCGDGKIEELVNRLNKDFILTIEPHLKVFEGYSAIDNKQMKHKFNFGSNIEAFDSAVAGLKNILKNNNFAEGDGKWVKR